MGRVFLAEDSLLARQVALKVLPKQRSQGGTGVQRFRREARALAKLNHNNIVRVHDVDTREDTHYIVMEFIDGADLATVVKRQGPLSEDSAAEYIRQTALGLEHAHSSGLIHRDIKPANLLLDSTGTIKILDLGLALLQTDEDASITADPTRTLGTVDYVSPEQALNSHAIDHRTDLYSLGCTLHFLLTGKPPFAVGTNAQRLMAHQSQQPPDINSARAVAGLSNVSPWLISVCRKLMEKSPDDRYTSAAQLAEELGQPSSAVSEGGDTVATDSIATMVSGDSQLSFSTKKTTREGKAVRRRRSSRGLRMLLGISAVLTLTILSIPIAIHLTSKSQPSGDNPEMSVGQTPSLVPAAIGPIDEIDEDTTPTTSLLSGDETRAGYFYVVGDNKTYHSHSCSILRTKNNLHEVPMTETSGLKPCGRCKP